MNRLIEGLALFALGLGAVVLILIWHKFCIKKVTVSDREMWKARGR